MSRAGRVVTYAKLLTAVWGAECREEVEYLRTFVRQLRKKIEDDPSNPLYLLTDVYVGYRFADAQMFQDAQPRQRRWAPLRTRSLKRHCKNFQRSPQLCATGFRPGATACLCMSKTGRRVCERSYPFGPDRTSSSITSNYPSSIQSNATNTCKLLFDPI